MLGYLYFHTDSFFSWLFKAFQHESTAFGLALSMVCIALVFSLFILGNGFYYRFFKFRKISSMLNDIVSSTDDVSKRRTIFAERFHSIKAAFLASPLKHSWLEFEEIIIADDKEKIYKNTSRPQNFFSVSDLKHSPAKWSFVPNIFVGFGLLFTFIGLAAAIGVASKTMGAETNAAQMQAGLGKVLEIASVKFITSITGLGLSIILSLVIRSSSHSAHRRIETICENLEQCMKALTSQYIQEKQLAELKQQTSVLSKFSDSFAVNLGEELERRLGNMITTSFASAMKPMNDMMSEQLEKSEKHGSEQVQGMVEKLSNSMNSGIKEQMESTVLALGDIKTAMADVVNKVNNSGDGFGKSMELACTKIQALLEESFETSAKGMSAEIAGSTEELKESLTQASASFTQTLSQSSDKIGGASSELSSNISKFVRGIDTFDTQIMANIEGFERGARNIKDTVEALDGTAQNIKTASEPIAKVAETFSKSSENLIDVSKNIAETYESIKDINVKISEYSQTISDSWKEYRDRFENVDESLENIFKQFDENVSNIIAKINDFTGKTDKAYNTAGGELSKAIGALKDTVEELVDYKEAS